MINAATKFYLMLVRDERERLFVFVWDTSRLIMGISKDVYFNKERTQKPDDISGDNK